VKPAELLKGIDCERVMVMALTSKEKIFKRARELGVTEDKLILI
jgi:hypothetical protein